MTHNKKAVIIRVSGRVQGVGFRYYTQQKAKELSITGYVKNKPDRSVYIEAEGSEDNLQTFIDWCKIGPQRAIVANIDIQVVPKLDYHSFKIN